MVIDRLNNEIKIGDWVACTSKNDLIVGKVIRLTNSSVVVSENIIQEELEDKNISGFSKVKKYLEDNYPDKDVMVMARWYKLSHIRDSKFVKIYPTTDLVYKYNTIKNK